MRYARIRNVQKSQDEISVVTVHPSSGSETGLVIDPPDRQDLGGEPVSHDVLPPSTTPLRHT